MPESSPTPGLPSRAEQVKRLIRRRYARVARQEPIPPGGRARALADGYPPEWLADLPSRLSQAYSGCGFALQEVDLSGVRVAVDLGCGAGMDACLAARLTGGAALVIALDLTFPMLERVREAAQSLSEPAVCAVTGDMEQLPLGDNAADLVLANAAFNLTLDKRAAFAEAARILRPGGLLVCRELIRVGELPVELAQDPMAWSTSLGGVLEEETLCEAARAGGLVGVRVSHHSPFPPVVAVRLEARKPS